MNAGGVLEPRLLHMAAACTYTQRSRWTLARAARAGLLAVAGRNGRSLVFERVELDRWMIGEPSPQLPAPSHDLKHRAAPSSAAALERLHALKSGAA